MSIEIDRKAPDFSAEAFHVDRIKRIALSDFRGRWVLLFFYPADFTCI